MNQEFEKLLQDRWVEALNAYGTPADFTQNTIAIIIESDSRINGMKEIPFTHIYAPGYANRKELMDAQKKQAAERAAKGLPQRWINDGSPCFLCDNAGQARDIGKNLILPWDRFKNHILMPNKYPGYYGEIMIVAKKHNKPGQERMPFPEDYLATALEIAEKYQIAFLRNHERAGMSIPEHEHILMKPIEVDSSLGVKTPITQIADAELSPTEYGTGIYRVEMTRFDTLALSGRNSLENMVRLTAGLRRDEQIFTFYYHPRGECAKCGELAEGVFYVSAWRNLEQGKKAIGGAGTPLHHDVTDTKEHPSYGELLKVPTEFLHVRGEFGWGEYF